MTDTAPPPRRLVPGQRTQVQVASLDDADSRVIFEADTILLEAPNWGTDGALYLNGDGLLWRLDLHSRQLRPVAFTGLPPINNDHVVTPDGGRVLMSAADGHIYSGSITGGHVERVSPDDGRWHFLHGVSPDGERIAYVEIDDFSEPGRLAVLSLRTGEKQLFALNGHVDGPEWTPDGTSIVLNAEHFTSSRGHAQIVRLDEATQHAELLLSSRTVDWFPHISPDGTHATYLRFPTGTLGHPADLDVDIVLVAVEDWSVSLSEHRVFGGQGTLNVNSWSPDSQSYAFVSYPILDTPISERTVS